MPKRYYPEEFIYLIRNEISRLSNDSKANEIEKLEHLAFYILCILDGVTCNDIDIDRIAKQCESIMMHEGFYEK